MSIVFKGTKFITEIPKEAGRIVDLCEFNKKLYAACEYGVFFLHKGKLYQVEFFRKGEPRIKGKGTAIPI